MLCKRQFSKTGILAAAIVVGTGAAAMAQFKTGDKLGLSVSGIAKNLEDEGYDIREIEVKSRYIEADVTLDGKKLEIEIDRESGLITEIEDD